MLVNSSKCWWILQNVSEIFKILVTFRKPHSLLSYFDFLVNLQHHSYCRPGSNPGWNRSKFANMSCMALCEICYHADDAHHHVNKQVNSSSQNPDYMTDTFGSRKKDPKNRWVKTSGIYVVDQEECVMTRYFLIFPNKHGYKGLEANSLMGSLPKLQNKWLDSLLVGDDIRRRVQCITKEMEQRIESSVAENSSNDDDICFFEIVFPSFIGWL